MKKEFEKFIVEWARTESANLDRLEERRFFERLVSLVTAYALMFDVFPDTYSGDMLTQDIYYALDRSKIKISFKAFDLRIWKYMC